jgi:hypothetical protein
MNAAPPGASSGLASLQHFGCSMQGSAVILPPAPGASGDMGSICFAVRHFRSGAFRPVRDGSSVSGSLHSSAPSFSTCSTAGNIPVVAFLSGVLSVFPARQQSLSVGLAESPLGIECYDEVGFALLGTKAEWIVRRVRRNLNRVTNLDVLGPISDEIHESSY